MSNLTAAEEVLMAAHRLSGEDTGAEFTEWNLTVETWRFNKSRWGLRGYALEFPDHKRVMNEVMAKGTQKVLGKNWLKRIRKNTYVITSIGITKAQSLSGHRINDAKRAYSIYDAVEKYALSPVFEKFLKNPSEPKSWIGVISFLDLSDNHPDVLKSRLNEFETAVNDAKNFLDSTGSTILKRGDSGRSIPKQHLEKLSEFLKVLEERFSIQFNAIRKGKK